LEGVAVVVTGVEVAAKEADLVEAGGGGDGGGGGGGGASGRR
jgi:hypothetical protein